MRLAGFLLLVSGWIIALSALILVHGNAQSAFALAGLAVEILGLVFVVRTHIIPHGDHG